MATFAGAHEFDPAYHPAVARRIRVLFTEYRANRDLVAGILAARAGGATSALLAKVASGILPYVDTEELFGAEGLTDSELFERYEEVFPEMLDEENLQKLDEVVDGMLSEKRTLHAEKEAIADQVAEKFMSRIG